MKNSVPSYEEFLFESTKKMADETLKKLEDDDLKIHSRNWLKKIKELKKKLKNSRKQSSKERTKKEIKDAMVYVHHLKDFSGRKRKKRRGILRKKRIL